MQQERRQFSGLKARRPAVTRRELFTGAGRRAGRPAGYYVAVCLAALPVMGAAWTLHRAVRNRGDGFWSAVADGDVELREHTTRLATAVGDLVSAMFGPPPDVPEPATAADTTAQPDAGTIKAG